MRAITGAELTVATSPPMGSTPQLRRGLSPTAPPGLAHLTLLVEDAARLPQPLPAADRRPLAHARQPGAQRRPAVGDAGAGGGARRGPGLPLRLRPRRRARRRLGARRHRARGAALARRLLAAFGPRALPGRAAAPLLAPRPRPQPLARRTRRAPRRPRRRHRQRPLPHAAAAPTCRTPSSRSGCGETLEESEPLRRGNRSSALVSPAGDGGALRRAPRGRRRDRAPRRAPPVRPDRASSATATRAEGDERRRRARRALRRPLAERYAGRLAAGREAEARLERGAGDDPPPQPLRLLPPPPRPAGAGPRGRASRCAGRTRPAPCCRRAAAAAPASARSSAT